MKGLAKSVIEKATGAKKGPMPSGIEPMKATLVDDSFSRDGWIFENKYDGVRSLCYISKGQVKLISRNQNDMSIKYPELDALPEWIKADSAIIDGEIVVLNNKGTADFQALQGRFGLTNLKEIDKLTHSQTIVLYAFDLLYLDGYNLMRVPLIQRKALLKKIVKERKSLQYADHIEREGEKLFAKAERAHLEGIIAKNASSFYEEKRSNEWLKIKTIQRQEAVICGYTAPTGSREYFGALHLGLYQGKELVSVGKVGSGFDRAKLKTIFETMKPYRTDEHPFDIAPKEVTRWHSKEDVQWLKPKLVCEVRFSERTVDGSFRHPVFEGLRYDKKPTQCKYEVQHNAGKEVKSAEKKTPKLAAILKKRTTSESADTVVRKATRAKPKSTSAKAPTKSKAAVKSKTSLKAKASTKRPKPAVSKARRTTKKTV